MPSKQTLVVTSVVVFATSVIYAADEPSRPVEKIIPDALLDECLKRGKNYAECDASEHRTRMMSWSRGVWHEPFQEGLGIGGMPFGDGLVLSLNSPRPYRGKLLFDQARRTDTPACFVVEPDRKYIVTLSISKKLDTLQEMVMLGRRLIDGLPIDLEPDVIGTAWVQQVEDQELPAMSLMPPGFLDLARYPLHSLDPPVLLPDGREFKTWEQPARHTRTFHVSQKHPKADDSNPGT